ncbi:GNAT family N-acetyltransferase [bacterium]|nr:GNAT family N-acetyltransferase [bacterium]
MNSSIRIRPARPDDRGEFYEVCLKTSDNGADGSHLHDDPDALGHLYVGPYLALESTFSFALEDEMGVCGYCFGTPDSESFYQRFKSKWLPPIQQTLQTPIGEPSNWTLSEQLHDLLLHPDKFIYFPESFAAYPAHMHIDLLPRAQGQGWGRKLLEQEMNLLRSAGAHGVHLAVAPGNTRALAFYRKLGFQNLPAGPDAPEDTVFQGRVF